MECLLLEFTRSDDPESAAARLALDDAVLRGDRPKAAIVDQRLEAEKR